MDSEYDKFIELFEKVAGQNLRPSWSESQIETVRVFILDRIPHYAEYLNLSPFQILEAMERDRDISVPNYYQNATFPRLDINSVYVLRDLEHYKQIVGVAGFRCPSCGEISPEDPYRCGAVKGGVKCGWKSYGFFRTMGKGLRLLLRDQFLNEAVVYEIFMPVALEHLFENGVLIPGEQFPD